MPSKLTQQEYETNLNRALFWIDSSGKHYFEYQPDTLPLPRHIGYLADGSITFDLSLQGDMIQWFNPYSDNWSHIRYPQLIFRLIYEALI